MDHEGHPFSRVGGLSAGVVGHARLAVPSVVRFSPQPVACCVALPRTDPEGATLLNIAERTESAGELAVDHGILRIQNRLLRGGHGAQHET